jgi:hypothetical protein
MTEDGYLHARRTDPETSHDAADRIDSADVTTLACFLFDHDRPEGWTCFELSVALGWDEYRTSKRASDVRKLHGLAVYAGGEGMDIYRRPGPSGRGQYAIRSVRAIALQYGLTPERVLSWAQAWDAWQKEEGEE